MEVLSANEDEKPSLRSMMALLVDMNARLATDEQRVEILTAEMEARPQSLSTGLDDPSISRGATRRGMMTGPQLSVHDTFPEVIEEVRARVASHFRGAPALYLQNTNNV